jgi:hypothetical protein
MIQVITEGGVGGPRNPSGLADQSQGTGKMKYSSICRKAKALFWVLHKGRLRCMGKTVFLPQNIY